MSARGDQPTERGAAALFVAALVVAAAGSLVVWGAATASRPTAADWDAAEHAVRGGWRAGDAVTVVPGWAERARERLGDLEFLVSKDPERELDAAALAGVPRLWVVAPFGAAAAARGPLAERFGAPAEWLRPGRVEVLRFEPPGARPLLVDLGARLGEASAHVEPHGAPDPAAAARPCERVAAPDGPDAGREVAWRCGREDWQVVRRRTVRVGGGPLTCLWAHPHAPGSDVVLEWSGVQGAAVAGLAGLQWRATWAERGADPRGDALVALEVDGAAAATLRLPFAAERVPFDVPLSPGPHRVALRISAENHTYRMVCVRPLVLGAAP